MMPNQPLSPTPQGANSPTNRNWRRWAVLIAVILVLVIVPIWLIATSHNGSSGFPTADQEQGPIFQGMSAFVNNGLTTDQVNYLIQAFSKFSPHAKKVTIDTGSISPGPHDPGSAEPFTIGFNVTIDSKTYRGTASYSNLTSIQLVLSDLSGQPVFDSGVIPATE